MFRSLIHFEFIFVYDVRKNIDAKILNKILAIKEIKSES